MKNNSTIKLKHLLSNRTSYGSFEEYEILHEENGVKLIMLEHGYASISLYQSGVILGFIDEQDNIYDCTHHNLYTDNHSVQEIINFVFDKHNQNEKEKQAELKRLEKQKEERKKSKELEKNTINGIVFKQTKLF